MLKIEYLRIIYNSTQFVSLDVFFLVEKQWPKLKPSKPLNFSYVKFSYPGNIPNRQNNQHQIPKCPNED